MAKSRKKTHRPALPSLFSCILPIETSPRVGGMEQKNGHPVDMKVYSIVFSHLYEGELEGHAYTSKQHVAVLATLQQLITWPSP